MAIVQRLNYQTITAHFPNKQSQSFQKQIVQCHHPNTLSHLTCDASCNSYVLVSLPLESISYGSPVSLALIQNVGIPPLGSMSMRSISPSRRLLVACFALVACLLDLTPLERCVSKMARGVNNF
jgi:hypothetical protein